MNKMSSSEQDKQYKKENMELVVEENTIYEIDFECMKCMNRKKQENEK